ncbi:hypothetical protein HDF16_003910 [Granulicella aggregans]|uniref:Uncharacterized protein n=1 Tax=Granulicella aggregans TaxID=474949 RepID=A0A7W7ZG18_9BACT|nr:hypothetical protein [Granulicella aggregans]MBB5059187.1 hypothetical protein [Granulicella aggregans]
MYSRVGLTVILCTALAMTVAMQAQQVEPSKTAPVSRQVASPVTPAITPAVTPVAVTTTGRTRTASRLKKITRSG